MLKRFYIKIKQAVKIDKRKFVTFNYLMMSMMLSKMKFNLHTVSVFLMFAMKYILFNDL